MDFLNFFFPNGINIVTVKDLIIFIASCAFDFVAFIMVIKSILDITKNLSTGRFAR